MKKIILLMIEKIRKALKVDEKGNSFGWGIGTLLLAALMMAGYYQVEAHRNKQIQTDIVGGYIIKTIVYQGCEYVFVNNQRVSMTHKGNCRFCKERRQKELKELIEQLKK